MSRDIEKNTSCVLRRDRRTLVVAPTNDRKIAEKKGGGVGETSVGQQLRKNGLFFSHNPWIGYVTLTAFQSFRSYFYTVCIDENRVFGLSRPSIFLGRRHSRSARIVSHCTRPIHFFLLIAHRRFPF